MVRRTSLLEQPAAMKLPLLLIVLMLAGCADSSFHGTSTMSGTGWTETLTINTDGTYHQAITCTRGQTLDKNGQWQSAEDAGMGNVPGNNPNDPTIVLKNAYDTSNCCLATGTKSTTDEMYSESMFQLPSSEVQADQNAVHGWSVGIALTSFVLWAWALIDICLRNFEDVNVKIAWVVAIVVCGGIGSILYLINGRRAGEIPGQYRA